MFAFFQKFGNLTTNMLHIVGHGLGSHVAGYAGQSILPMVARITGKIEATILKEFFYCCLRDIKIKFRKYSRGKSLHK